MIADTRIPRKSPVPKKYAKSICNDSFLLNSREGEEKGRKVCTRTAFQVGKGLVKSRAKIPAPRPARGPSVPLQDSTGKQDWRSTPFANRLLEGGSGVSSEHPVSPSSQESSLLSRGNDRVQYPQLRRCTGVNKNMHLVRNSRGAVPERPAAKLASRHGKSPCRTNGPINLTESGLARVQYTNTQQGTVIYGVDGQSRPVLAGLPSATPQRTSASTEPIVSSRSVGQPAASCKLQSVTYSKMRRLTAQKQRRKVPYI